MRKLKPDTEKWLHGIFGLILGGLLVFSFSSKPVQAEPASLAKLLKFAVVHTGYKNPVENGVPFELVIVSKKKIAQIFFKGHNLGVLGFYPWSSNQIYVAEEVGTGVDARAIIVHEAVHYLQYHNGAPRETCEDQYELEREAYAIQREYLRGYGIHLPVNAALKNTFCMEK